MAEPEAGHGRRVTDQVQSWGPGHPPPGPDDHCPKCGRRAWWSAPDGSGGCMTCWPVQQFGADSQAADAPPGQPPPAPAKRYRWRVLERGY